MELRKLPTPVCFFKSICGHRGRGGEGERGRRVWEDGCGVWGDGCGGQGDK
ncbi:MAG: hypothetical protein ACHBN1_24765 [Heteroscytonema crispum UTEX LB 1556]